MLNFEFYRTAWTLNDIVSNEGVNKFKATHLCFVIISGSSPVYAVKHLGSGKIAKFYGSREALFKHFSKKIPVKVALRTRALDYKDNISFEERDDFISMFTNEEIKQNVKWVNDTKPNEFYEARI